MREGLVALFSGILFGVGLAISGMMDPSRVRGFLDILGNWDPTLAFVMGGALFVMALTWIIQGKLARPVFADTFKLPGTSMIDGKLISGSVLFGAGWGIAGLCPGPAIGALVVEPLSAAIFVGSMVGGMALHRVISQ